MTLVTGLWEWDSGVLERVERMGRRHPQLGEGSVGHAISAIKCEPNVAAERCLATIASVG